jgi:glutathione peroxidase
MSEFHELEAKLNNGQVQNFKDYEGKWVLIVNTASKCGFTPQYEGLEKLYGENKEKLEILAFPCNQFGAQEPGSADEIKEFCDLNFNVSFPLFDKVEVNGDSTHPVFTYLKKQLPGFMGTEKIKWNFTKFLVDPKGKPQKRFAPQDKPEKIGEFLNS